MGSKPLRTEVEREVGRNIEALFLSCRDSVEVRLENFTKYVRRQHLKRFLVFYELFKLVQNVKGSVIECGVYRGFGLMAWAKLSAILEPENLTRRIYAFDTFNGFPSIASGDRSPCASPEVGDLEAQSYEELTALIEEYDRDRFLGHISKVELIKGNIVETVPAFIESHPHLLVSLLFLDSDLYEPTKVALETFLPRMPAGSVVAFDELDNPLWPGETSALVESVGLRRCRLQRFDWDPYVSFFIVE